MEFKKITIANGWVIKIANFFANTDDIGSVTLGKKIVFNTNNAYCDCDQEEMAFKSYFEFSYWEYLIRTAGLWRRVLINRAKNKMYEIEKGVLL